MKQRRVGALVPARGAGEAMTLPVIVIGSGGHAAVVIETLHRCDIRIIGRTDADAGKEAGESPGVPLLGDDDAVLEYAPDSVRLVNGIGSVGEAGIRRRVFEHFRARGYRFARLVHPSAVVAADVVLGEGVQVMAGAIVQPGCRIGANTILNTGAMVDHHCVIGDHTHVAPGAVLAGNVKTGSGVHIGAGATVIQNVDVGADSVIAAGAVVVDPVPAATRVAGVPARSM